MGRAAAAEALRGVVGLRVIATAGYHAALFPPVGGHNRMKTDIHPKYQPVVFQDLSSDFAFLTQSTMSSKDTIKWEDGKEYPLIKVEISSHSHPFFTGKQKTIDSGGRVDKFRRRYAK
jgi:large subunit ribosomal protein L31